MSAKAVTIISKNPANDKVDAVALVDPTTNALQVKVVNPSSGGGGGGAVDLAEYGGNPVGAGNPIHVTPGTGAVFEVSDGGGSLTVDGAVSVSNFPAVYPVNDNGGSLTVDGTVGATQSGAWSVTVVDGGGSITVDGAVSVSNFPTTYPVTDNGGSLTVDGAVSVSNFPATYPVTDGGGSLTVDGTVNAIQAGSWAVDVINLTPALLQGQMQIFDAVGGTTPLRVASNGAANDANDGGLLLSAPRVALPKWAGPPIASHTNDLFLIRGDEAGNLMTSSFIRGRADTAPRILEVVVEGETYGSGPYTGGINGVTIGAPCVSDITAVTRTDQLFGTLRLDLNQRLWTTVGGLLPGTGATALGKAEDAAHSSGDVGVMSLAVRTSTEASLVSADNDYSPLLVDEVGRLKTQTFITAPDGSGTQADVFSNGDTVVSSKGMIFLVEPNDSPAPTTGRWSHPFMNRNGGLIVHVQSGSLAVTTDIARAEDAAHGTGHTGAFVLAVRQDTATALAGTNGDYIPFITDSSGRLHVNVGSFTPGTAAGSLGKAEDAAHSSGDTGVAVLAVRRDVLASNTSNDQDYATLSVSSVGALWTREWGVTNIVLSGSTRGRPIQITGTSSGASVTVHTATTTAGELDRIYLWLANTSSSSVTVTIEFGTTGTGNELSFVVPPKETILALDGVALGGGSTDTVKAFASSANVVNVLGRVERLAA